MAAIKCAKCGGVGESWGATLYCHKCYQAASRQSRSKALLAFCRAQYGATIEVGYIVQQLLPAHGDGLDAKRRIQDLSLIHI